MVYYLDENASIMENSLSFSNYISDVVHETQMGYMQSNYRYLVENDTEKPKGEKEEEKEMWLVRMAHKIAEGAKRFWESLTKKLREMKTKIKEWWGRVKDRHQQKKLERAQKAVTNAQNKINKLMQNVEDAANRGDASGASEGAKKLNSQGTAAVNNANDATNSATEEPVPESFYYDDDDYDIL